MKHLIRFVVEEENDKIVKTYLCKDNQYNLSLSVNYSQPPCMNIYGYVIPAIPKNYFGEFKIFRLIDDDIIRFIVGHTKSTYRIQIFRNITSFDPDDIEMALDVRSVHLSPNADHDLTGFITNYQFLEERNVEKDMTYFYLSELAFSFTAPLL
jgi:hypothetical protein